MVKIKTALLWAVNSTDSPDTSSGRLVEDWSSPKVFLGRKKKSPLISVIKLWFPLTGLVWDCFCLFLWGFVPLFLFFLSLRCCVLHLFLSAAVKLSVFLSRVNVSAVRLLWLPFSSFQHVGLLKCTSQTVTMTEGSKAHGAGTAGRTLYGKHSWAFKYFASLLFLLRPRITWLLY